MRTRAVAHATRWATHSPSGLLLSRMGLALVVYTAIRVLFLVEHRTTFAAYDAAALLGAFAHGIRFDLSALAYSNLPFILLSLAPASVLSRPWYQRVLMGLFVAVNGAFAIMMVGDVGYYPFTGTRITLDVFALTGDAMAQVDQLLVNFWGLTTVGLLLVAALVAAYPRTPREGVSPQTRLAHAALVFTTLVLTIGAARGGLQKKPVKPLHAFASGQHDLGILTLNSAFTLIHTPREQGITPVQYFADDAEVEAVLSTPYGYPERELARPPARPQNVVLLILESFGTEYWGDTNRDVTGLTPFLDSLSAHGTFLTQAFANGRRSMDALPSILLGVPRYSGQSIAVSEFQGNEWRGLGHFLEDGGYHTSMFHGAPKGTMYFDAIAAMAGIREFYPLERFPEEVQDTAFDGHWGLFDEPALEFAVEQLGTHREPWFTTLFTISTHHPYRVPEQYRDVLPRGTQEIHQSVAYVDLAVRRFFEAARRQPWFDQTLFIVTGDHTAPLRSPRYDTPLGRYMVPVLLYHPGGQLPAVDPARITQHVDLFKTVLDYAGIRPDRVPMFGRSIFADVPGEAVLATDETFWLVRREGVLERAPDGRERVLEYQEEETGTTAGTLTSAPSAQLSQRLLAYVQHFTSSMLNNSFYRDPGVRSPR